MSDPRDRAVVVGAGHNGLVAACYLAKAGLDVTVVERDTVVGGAVSTVERFPGYRMDRGSSAHIMVRHTGIVEDLRLTEVGLEYQDLDPWGFAPFGDEGIHFFVDLDRTCASIEQVCGARDADAYRAFVLDWSARNVRVFEAFQGAPTGMHLGRTLWGVGKSTGLPGLELSRQFLTSADSLLDEHFDDERLKTALAWMGAQSGPPTHEVATADLVGWNTVMHLRPPGHPKGGSGMLSEALQARLESYGGRVLLGDGAAQIVVRGGRAGRACAPTAAPSSSPTRSWPAATSSPRSTCSATACPRDLAERARRSVRTGNGIGMVVRLATSALPQYAAGTSETHRSMQLIAPSRQALRKAHGEFSAGLPPEHPAALAMTFSAFDDTIAPPGKHNVTVWGQWHPYALSNGETLGRDPRARGHQARRGGRPRGAGLRVLGRADARADPAGPRAGARPALGAGDARGDGLRPDVHVAADARAVRLHGAAGAGAVPVRRVDPPGRRRVRRQRPVGGRRRAGRAVAVAARPRAGSGRQLRG